MSNDTIEQLDAQIDELQKRVRELEDDLTEREGLNKTLLEDIKQVKTDLKFWEGKADDYKDERDEAFEQLNELEEHPPMHPVLAELLDALDSCLAWSNERGGFAVAESTEPDSVRWKRLRFAIEDARKWA